MKRMRSTTSIGLVAAAFAGLFGACGGKDVVVARDTAPTMGGPCKDIHDCLAVEFCSKPSCTAAEGQCQPRPVMCGGESSSTCGCDGVNYWNDCLRRQSGIAASVPGECTDEYFVCGGHKGTACPTAGALCARFVLDNSGACDPALAGVCWRLPPQCPSDDGGAVWQSCGPRPPQCLDACRAIRAETPFRPSDGRCP